MDPEINAQEREYWTREARDRASAVDSSIRRDDAPHVVAAARLRLREAEERLAALPAPDEA